MPSIRRMSGAAVTFDGKKGFLVNIHEVSAIMAEHKASPEIIIACIVVSGTLDTRRILRSEIILAGGGLVSGKERAAYDAFLRVFRNPQGDEMAKVKQFARDFGLRHPDELVWPISV